MLAVNEAGVLLASAARKTSVTSPEMENRNCKGVIVTLDATNITPEAMAPAQILAGINKPYGRQQNSYLQCRL